MEGKIRKGGGLVDKEGRWVGAVQLVGDGGGEMRQRKKSIFTCHGNIRRST